MSIEGRLGVTLDPITVSAAAITQMRFALQNARNAAKSSIRVKEIEQANISAPFGDHFEAALHEAKNCLSNIADALDAYASEIYEDRVRHFSTSVVAMLPQHMAKLDRQPGAIRLAEMLVLSAGVNFNRQAWLSGDIHKFKRLRNELVHFKPQPMGSQGSHAQLSADLQSSFTGSPFLPPSESLFPRRWASHSCTLWAMKTLIAFIQDFEAKAGIQTKVAGQIATLSF